VARGPSLSGVVLDGRYQVIEPIAEGAMGVVYRAERVGLGRAVAIKVMHESLPGQLSSHQRFEREAKLMAKLEHPNCVSVIDFGIHEDKPFVVMDLVRGTSLHELIVRNTRLDQMRAADILRQVLSGLGHAHELGIIHRDIKPANVMVTEKSGIGEQVRILDFGLARLRESNTHLTTGIVVGTPSYMAPEQCRGGEVDLRVDLYACGVMLFEMLTSRKPFLGDDPIVIVRKHLQEMPPRLGDVIPEDFGALEDIIARALEKEPDRRFQTAAEMSLALETAVGGRVSGPMGRMQSQPVIAARPATGSNPPTHLGASGPGGSGPGGSGPSPSSWDMPELGSSAILSESVSPSVADAPVVSASMLTDEKSRALSDQLDELRVDSRLGTEPPVDRGRFPTGPTTSRASTLPPMAQGSGDDSLLQTVPRQKAPDVAEMVAERDRRAESKGRTESKAQRPSRPRKDHDASIMRMLPRSRMRWAVLLGVILVGGGVYGILYMKHRLAEEAAAKADAGDVAMPHEIDMSDPAADAVKQASDLLASGDVEGAIDTATKARKQYPQSAGLPYVAGRAYFAKYWWTDGIDSFRAAIKLDPTYRSDRELIRAALKGFIVTPRFDERLAGFLVELGSGAVPYIEETAKTHHNPQIRDRASALLRRFR
jgi:serine/threonine protein kinase